MFRQVFVRGNGTISNYCTTESLSPNTWTYVLMARNQQYISINGIMQLVRHVPTPPPPNNYRQSPKQTIKKSPTVKNIIII